MKAKAWCDGGGNPDFVCAAILRLEDGREFEQSMDLGKGLTSNIAEYEGLLLALKMAHEFKVDDLTVYSDSSLIVNQVNGKWAIRNKGLLPLLRQARAAGLLFRSVDLQWIPREQNEKADLLCRETEMALSIAQQEESDQLKRQLSFHFERTLSQDT